MDIQFTPEQLALRDELRRQQGNLPGAGTPEGQAVWHARQSRHRSRWRRIRSASSSSSAVVVPGAAADCTTCSTRS